MASEQQITDLKNRHAKRLLSIKGVSGVGVEKDERGGYVLAVHVNEPAARVPREIEGFLVRRVLSGEFGKFSDSNKGQGKR